MAFTVKDTIKTRLIAILAADGVDEASLNKMKISLETAGAQIKIIAPHLGNITSSGGKPVKVDQSFLIAASVLFDAVYVPDGTKSASSLKENPNAVTFINEANLHCKAIAANGAGVEFLQMTEAGFGITGKNKSVNRMGVLINSTPKEFVEAIAQHRFWDRENSRRSSKSKS
jgi:catalase